MNNPAFQIVTINGKKEPKIYWNGMTSAQLGAYQRDQGTRNDCAIYSIAAALNLLENPSTLFEGYKIALEVDQLWKSGCFLMRTAPNFATLPINQRLIVEYLSVKYSLNYRTSSVYPSFLVRHEDYKEIMRSILTDNNRLQLVTIYFTPDIAPEMWNPNDNSTSPFNLKWFTDQNRNDVQVPGTGHTMLLVAYDPTNVHTDAAGNTDTYEWGFVNSWRIGGEIYWMKNDDLKIFDVVEIIKK